MRVSLNQRAYTRTGARLDLPGGDLVAVRAAHLHVDELAALAVGVEQRLALGPAQVAVAPFAQRHECRVEVEPHPGEPVLVPDPRPGLLVRLTPQHAMLHQAGQAVGEDLARDRRTDPEIVEAADAEEDLAENEHR